MLRTLAAVCGLILSAPLEAPAETLDELVDRVVAASAAAAPRLLVEVSSPERSEYNLSASADGRLRVFARSEAGFTKARIYVSRLGNGRWSNPEPIAFSDTRWRDSDPWLTPDGRTLYFASDRPTAARPDKTDLDVWRSRRLPDGRWSAPEHLGEVVNSRGEELGPEVHDGRLYFGSARRSGRGGLDIYVAQPSADGWAAPELLPEPVNSAASESDFTLSPEGRTALFWRMVDGRGLLHAAERTGDGWSTPRLLPAAINLGGFNFTPAFSADGRRITFASAPEGEGLADVYEAERP